MTFRNNVVINDIDYQMGGHNEEPIIISGNVFSGFFNFFDCQFGSTVTIINNVFLKNTNILGNQDTGFANTFESGFMIQGNAGEIDIDDTKA